jgi:hypothetical protein
MIDVDYGMDPRRIFQQAFRAMIEKDSISFFKEGIKSICWVPNDLHFPSWAPDVADMPRRKEIQRECSISGLEKGNSPTTNHPSAIMTNNGSVLKISGIQFDVVEEAIHMTPFDTFWDPGLISKLVSKTEDFRSRNLRPLHPLTPVLGHRSSERLISVLSGDAYNKESYEFLTDIVFQRIPRAHLPSILPDNQEHQSLLTTYVNSLMAAHRERVTKRVMVFSKAGFVGVGSPYIKAGDTIAFLYGMNNPLILRRETSSEDYGIVG